MKRSIVSITAFSTLALLHIAALAQEPTLPQPWLLGEAALPRRAGPKIVQQDMHEAACRFVEKAYPEIDKDWARKEFGKALLQDRYAIFRVDRGFWPTVRVGGEGTIKLEMTFPWCEFLSLEAGKPPPWVTPEKLKKSLTLGEAESRAHRVLTRLAGDAQSARGFNLTDSGEARTITTISIFTSLPLHHFITSLDGCTSRFAGLME